MSKEQRRSDIVNYINAHGYVTFNELKQRFPGVSDMTIRTDLKELSEANRLVRLRGGAQPAQEVARPDDSFFLRTSRNLEKRQQIARKTIEYLRSQMELKPTVSIFMDGGVTIHEIAKIFPNEWCTIVTNSISCAYELSKLTRPYVTVLGGVLNRYNCTCDAMANIETLERLNFDFAIIPAAGYSVSTGFTCGKEVMDETRNIIKKHSKTIIVPIDSSKMDVIYPVTHSHVEEVNIIISDDELSEEMRQHFLDMEVEVL